MSDLYKAGVKAGREEQRAKDAQRPMVVYVVSGLRSKSNKIEPFGVFESSTEAYMIESHPPYDWSEMRTEMFHVRREVSE